MGSDLHAQPYRSIVARLRRLAALPVADVLRLTEATAWLVLASLLVNFVPIRYWERLLGRQCEGAPVTHGDGSSTREGAHVMHGDGSSTRKVAGCARWIGIAARHLPWQVLCLPQAAALSWMLRRRGYRPILVLGVRRRDDSSAVAGDGRPGIDAHAWLIEGGQVAIGGDIRSFVALCHFA